MRYIKKLTGIALMVAAASFTGCVKEPPKCSDEDTLTLVRKIILDQIGGSEKLTEKEIKDNLKIEYSRASAFEEKIKKLTHQSKEEKRNLQTIRDCPELLAKILIIQDKFPEFYEKLPTEPNLLKKYESGEIAEDIELQKLIPLLKSQIGHCVKRVSYHDENGLGGLFNHLRNNRFNDFLVYL